MSYTFKFGKYSGWPISEVPESYLEYLLAESESTAAAITAELDRRAAVESASTDWCERLIRAGHRALARENHPDKGGSNQDMQEINAAVELLRAAVRAPK